jgi:hypothetical protein
MQVPKQNKEIIGGKHKNKESSGMGHSMGRVHMQKQDLNTMNLMKFKVLAHLAPSTWFAKNCCSFCHSFSSFSSSIYNFTMLVLSFLFRAQSARLRLSGVQAMLLQEVERLGASMGRRAIPSGTRLAFNSSKNTK